MITEKGLDEVHTLFQMKMEAAIKRNICSPREGMNVTVLEGRSKDSMNDQGLDNSMSKSSMNNQPDLFDQTFRVQSAPRKEVPECVICMSAPRSTRVFPCSHSSMCSECLDRLMCSSTPHCPLCRETIESVRTDKAEYVVRSAIETIDGSPRTIALSRNRRLAVHTIGGVNPSDLEVIGQATSGYPTFVQVVNHTPSGTTLALKHITTRGRDAEEKQELIDEIQRMYFADCPSLIHFHGTFLKDHAICICTEWMDLGSLQNILSQCNKIPEDILASFAYQMLWGLAYLKFENTFHRKLHPAHILCNSKGQVKLTSFGLERGSFVDPEECSLFPSPSEVRYMAPEQIGCQAFNYKTDIWALGLVLMECATGKFAYPECRGHVMFKVSWHQVVQTIIDSPAPDLDDSFSAECRDFIGHCLKKQPAERLPADILLASPWFEKNGVVNIDTAQEKVATWFSSQQLRSKCR
jgi:mitogen-activated protein kinase kinase 1